jgi:hypothetical protein
MNELKLLLEILFCLFIAFCVFNIIVSIFGEIE